MGQYTDKRKLSGITLRFRAPLQPERHMNVTNENQKKMLLESWVNQFSDELYCWAFYKPLQKDRQDLVQETFVGFS
jgi:hypothetical protein